MVCDVDGHVVEDWDGAKVRGRGDDALLFGKAVSTVLRGCDSARMIIMQACRRVTYLSMTIVLSDSVDAFSLERIEPRFLIGLTPAFQDLQA